MNARCKWKEFNKWWEVKRLSAACVWGDVGGLAQSIDNKLKELQEDKNVRRIR